MSPRSLTLILLAPAAALSLAACSMPTNVPLSSARSSPSSTATPSAVVTVNYSSFEPFRVTIHAGQTVEWLFQEAPTPANVAFSRFSSPTLVSGTWAHTFSSAGTYTYVDSLRQEATGVVTVLP